MVQFCTNFLPGGGIQTHVVDLTRCLRAQGHHVILAGEPGAGSAGEPEASFLALPLDEVSTPGQPLLRRLAFAVRAAWRLRSALRRLRVDLIHAHETAPALVARLATLGLPVPVVLTFHGAEPARLDSVARIARHCADLVLSPSRTTLGFLTDRGLPADRARVMGLGVHALPPVEANDAAALRRELLGGNDGVLFFSLSRLDRQKGLDVMIEVARRVIAVRPEVVFVVAGGIGSHAREVERWIEQAGVAENFHLVGVTGEAELYLAAADVYLLTSRWEALPISIVEAFRAGLPVLATDCGGVKELVSADVGRLCAVEDVEALSHAVLELAGDEDLRRRLGAAALELSREARFSPEAVYTEFESVYAQLLARRARTAA